MRTPRCVVIGLDSADFDLVVRWADAGLLPALGGLLRRAAWGRIANPIGFEAGSAWPTWATGVGPEVHGQYDGWFKFDTRTYQPAQLSPDEVPCRTLWQRASDAGRRVCVIDYPYAFHDPGVNGIQVADWHTHVRTMPHGLTTTPPGLAASIAAEFGTNPLVHDDPCPSNYADLSAAPAVATFRDRLVGRVQAKAALSERLLRDGDADLFITVFHEPHDVGHMCWHLHDPAHERHDAAIAAAVGDPVRDVYAAVDAAVARLLAATTKDDLVLVHLSHGMGTERTASNFLTDILEAIDDAYRGPPPPTRLDRVRGVWRALVPAAVRDAVNRQRFAKQVYVRNEDSRVRSRAFFELSPNQSTGGVRFNLAGRERNGIVQPGAAYRALRDRLAGDLRAIENPDTGRPLVDAVLSVDELYAGPRRGSLPDLLLEWDKSGPIARVRSPLFGELANRRPRLRTGDHINKDGVYFALGPGILPGRIGRTVNVKDFAPTLSRRLGLPEDGYDGAAIPELADGAPARPGAVNR